MNKEMDMWAKISARLRRQEVDKKKRSNAYRGMKSRALVKHYRGVFGSLFGMNVNFPTYERNGKI